jgi:clan AA aspartic protease
MGIIKTNINLSNAGKPLLEGMTINALVDTSSLHLCIPESIAIQLKLEIFEKRTVTLADGSSKLVDYVGPILLKWENRQCLVGALVLGNQALLGAIPMEDMRVPIQVNHYKTSEDVMIHPAQLKLIVNPEHPNIAASIAM